MNLIGHLDHLGQDSASGRDGQAANACHPFKLFTFDEPSAAATTFTQDVLHPTRTTSAQSCAGM